VVLSTDPPVDRRDGDVAPKRFDRRDTHLRGDARRLETATSDFLHRDALPHRRVPRARLRHLRRITIMTLDSHAIKRDARRESGAQSTMQ
jgi:hypothetical protein